MPKKRFKLKPGEKRYHVVKSIRSIKNGKAYVSWRGLSPRCDTWEDIAAVEHTDVYKAYVAANKNLEVVCLPKRRGRKPMRKLVAADALLQLATPIDMDTPLWIAASTPEEHQTTT